MIIDATIIIGLLSSSIKRLRKKSHIIIWIDAEKHLTKQHPLILKKRLSKIFRKCTHLLKVIYEKSIANLTFNAEILNLNILIIVPEVLDNIAINNIKYSLARVAQLVWVSSYTLKSCWFCSWSRHISGLWVWSLVKAHAEGNLCLSLTVLSPLLFSPPPSLLFSFFL